MNILQILIIIISVSALCFLLFQLWFFIENYDYIVDFNTKYSNLEFVVSPNLYFIDKSVFDPNDYQTDPSKKFRCAKDPDVTGGPYYFVSEDGFSSTNSIEINLSWSNLIDCITDGFDTNNIILYPACEIDSSGPDCTLLNKLMASTSN